MVKAKHISNKILVALAALVIVLIATIIILVVIPREPSCSGPLGTWHHLSLADGGDYYYTFRPDGTGTFATPEGSYDFTYADDSDLFSITFPGNTRAGIYPYRVNAESTILTITSPGGETLDFKCH